MSEPGKQEPTQSARAEKKTPGMVDAQLKGNTVRVYV